MDLFVDFLYSKNNIRRNKYGTTNVLNLCKSLIQKNNNTLTLTSFQTHHLSSLVFDRNVSLCPPRLAGCTTMLVNYAVALLTMVPDIKIGWVGPTHAYNHNNKIQVDECSKHLNKKGLCTSVLLQYENNSSIRFTNNTERLIGCRFDVMILETFGDHVEPQTHYNQLIKCWV